MTTRLAPIVAVALIGAGCQRTELPPAGPSTTAQMPAASPPSLPRTPTLSGVVYESLPDGRRPLANVGIDVSVEYQSWPPKTTTDVSGRFELAGPAGNFKVIATKAGYSQPCRVPIASAIDGMLDIYMVSDETLSTSGIPASMPVRPPVLVGVVFEAAGGGRHLIAGATLIADFTAGMGWAPSATTKSDATGRFLLCGVENIGFGLSIYASADGYVSTEVPVDLRRAGSVDVELTRK